MMPAMGVEVLRDNRGSTPHSINLKFTSRLPYREEEVQTPSIGTLETIMMSRLSRTRVTTPACADLKENGDHYMPRYQAYSKFLEYRNSPKMVPRQPEQHSSGHSYVKRRTLSDTSAIREEDDSTLHRTAVRSLSTNPYRTLRARDKATRKVSFSDDLTIIGDGGDIKTKSTHIRQTRHDSLGDAGDRRQHRSRYTHLLKDKEDSSGTGDVDTVCHGLARLLGSKSKKADADRQGQTSQNKSEKSSKPKLTKGLGIPGKKVKKKMPSSAGSI